MRILWLQDSARLRKDRAGENAKYLKKGII
jgi:hypothetical protein